MPWKNKRRTEQYRREYMYGITPLDYAALMLACHGACCLCKEVFLKTPSIDHNHTTGKVRGLVCQSCNVFIGMIETKPLRLDGIGEYLGL